MTEKAEEVVEIYAEVYGRPQDEMKIMFVFGSDGLGHAFSFYETSGPKATPVCARKVIAKREIQDYDTMCVTCSAAAKAWATGDGFQVPS